MIISVRLILGSLLLSLNSQAELAQVANAVPASSLAPAKPSPVGHFSKDTCIRDLSGCPPGSLLRNHSSGEVPS